VAWSETSGIAWKCPLPEWGTSTPAIWGEAVFVTTQKGDDLLLIRISKSTGRIDWTRTAGTAKTERMELRKKGPGERKAQRFHETHNMASPSPVTDGERAIVHFGNGELASYDFQGNRQWTRNLQDDHGTYTIWWGHANSPVLHGDLVISACMQDSLEDLGGSSPSYLVAHDKRTGKEKWKTMRKTRAQAEQCDSYVTPLLRPTARGTELIVTGGNQLDAYDPSTGKQVWHLPGLNGNRVITGPTLRKDLVYATIGMRGALVAVRPGAEGELRQSAVAWRCEKSTPDSPSPVCASDLLFMVSDNGIATCLDAESGELRWRERIPGDYRSSPIAAEGRVYFLNMNGLTTVVAASSRFEKLAENRIDALALSVRGTENKRASGDDVTIASPAVSDGRIFLRGRRALYAIGRPFGGK